MASFLVVRSSFCLLLAIFCFTVNVKAREGKLFFGKFTHLDADHDVAPNPKAADVSPTLAHAPGPVQVGVRTGDAHFGPGSGMIPQTKESWPVPSSTTSTSDEEFDKLMEKFEETDRSEVENYDHDKSSGEFEEEEGSDDPEDRSGQKGEYHYYNDNDNNNDNNDENGYTYSTTSTSKYKSNPYNAPNGYENGREKHHPNEFETMEEYYKSLEEGSQEEPMP